MDGFVVNVNICPEFFPYAQIMVLYSPFFPICSWVNCFQSTPDPFPRAVARADSMASVVKIVDFIYYVIERLRFRIVVVRLHTANGTINIKTINHTTECKKVSWAISTTP